MLKLSINQNQFITIRHVTFRVLTTLEFILRLLLTNWNIAKIISCQKWHWTDHFMST